MIDRQGYDDYWSKAPYPVDVSREYERARHLAAWVDGKGRGPVPYGVAKNMIFDAAYDGVIIT